MSWMIDRDSLDLLQLALLKKKLEARILVTGPAGSGKTLMAVYSAKRIIETKQGSKVILIVFTNVLRDFINAGIEELGIPDTVAMTAHNWQASGRPSADYLIVDEVQDFHLDGVHQENNFRSLTIKDFVDRTRKGLLLFGDPAQRIFSNRQWEIHDLMKSFSFQLATLVANYRTPSAIARIAAGVCPTNALEESCMNEDNTADVAAITCTDDSSKAKCIATMIKNQGLTEVGILVPKRETGRKFFSLLNKEGINCEAYIRGDWNRGIRDINTIDFRTSNPKIVTYHSAKGLQFDTVFIVSGEMSPKKNEQLYVACTRCQRQLYILYSHQLCHPLAQLDETTLPHINWEELQ